MSQILEIYDNQADQYDRLEGTLDEEIRALFNHNAAFAPEQKGKILDLCAGTGQIREYFLRQEWDVYCLDGSEAMLRQCESKGFRKENLLHIDLEKQEIPFEDRSFDIVTCHAGLMYLKNATDVIEKMIKLTKLGGTVVLNIPHHTEDPDKSLKITDDFDVDMYAPSTNEIFQKIISGGGNMKADPHIRRTAVFPPEVSNTIFTIEAFR